MQHGLVLILGKWLTVWMLKGYEDVKIIWFSSKYIFSVLVCRNRIK